MRSGSDAARVRLASSGGSSVAFALRGAGAKDVRPPSTSL